MSWSRRPSHDDRTPQLMAFKPTASGANGHAAGTQILEDLVDKERCLGAYGDSRAALIKRSGRLV